LTLFCLVSTTDAILEIHGYTGFADEFTHISQNNARLDNLALSICAVLAAEACNIGIEPLVNPENPALTYARLLRRTQAFRGGEDPYSAIPERSGFSRLNPIPSAKLSPAYYRHQIS
jgi:Tn3 transposase DDE domain